MSITIQPPPGPTRSALIDGLPDFIDPSHRMANELQKTPFCLHVFTLGLKDIVLGTGLQAAKTAGWRFLAVDPGGSVASSDVVERASAQRVCSVSYDPIIRNAIEALHDLHRLPEAQSRNYTVDVLRIPGIVVEAFWLKSSSVGDLLVPVNIRTQRLQVMRAYKVDEFLKIVKSLAGEVLAKLAALPGDNVPVR